jgi:DNA-binding IclR family transcriptional regulator
VTAKSTPQKILPHIMREVPKTISKHEPRDILERRLAQITPVEYFVDNKASAEGLVIASAQAPVSENGEARFALTIPKINQQLSVRALDDLAELGRDAADVITDSVATPSGHRGRESAGRA